MSPEHVAGLIIGLLLGIVILNFIILSKIEGKNDEND